MWSSPWLPRLFAWIFAPTPPETIWQWADQNVRFSKKMAAEPNYRSSKTPWARRIQEIARHPYHPNGRRIRRVVVRKSTQSGFTEAVLNIIRWCAKFAPRNFLYAINSKEEAENIRARLIETFAILGENVLPDDPKDEYGKYILRLRALIGWFIGSYSSGAFSNKYAPLVIIDEKDDHAQLKGNASSGHLAAERHKTADDDALQIELGKPQQKGGPIDSAHDEGNQEIYLVPCPHCGTCQEMEWERVRFGHCKDLTGHWDKQMVLNDTWHECIGCGGEMRDAHKPWMNEHGHWLATAGRKRAILRPSRKASAISILSTEARPLGISPSNSLRPAMPPSAGISARFRRSLMSRLGRGFESRVETIDLRDVDKCRQALQARHYSDCRFHPRPGAGYRPLRQHAVGGAGHRSRV